MHMYVCTCAHMHRCHQSVHVRTCVCVVCTQLHVWAALPTVSRQISPLAGSCSLYAHCVEGAGTHLANSHPSLFSLSLAPCPLTSQPLPPAAGRSSLHWRGWQRAQQRKEQWRKAGSEERQRNLLLLRWGSWGGCLGGAAARWEGVEHHSSEGEGVCKWRVWVQERPCR